MQTLSNLGTLQTPAGLANGQRPEAAARSLADQSQTVSIAEASQTVSFPVQTPDPASLPPGFDKTPTVHVIPGYADALHVRQEQSAQPTSSPPDTPK